MKKGKLVTMKYSQGLSLIELMVSMAISATLISGVLKIYANSNQTSRVQEAIGRMQENGRYALDIMARDIRMAGYVGCNGTIDPNNIINTLNAPPPSFQPGSGVQGWEADTTGLGTVNNSVADVVPVASTAGWSTSGGNILDVMTLVPDTDIIRLWGSSGSGVSIQRIVGNGANTVVEADQTSQFQDDDILLVSDCSFANWIQACNVTDIGGGATTQLVLSNGCNPGNDVNLPLSINEEGAEVHSLTGVQYYIGKRNNDKDAPPALYRQTLQGNGGIFGQARELIEGVESLQIVYGENLDGDSARTVDTYVSADLVTDWEQIISVRLSLLMHSLENNVTDSAKPYTFHGVTYGSNGAGNLPPDNRLRRVFTMTVNIRNRMLGI